MLFNLIYNSFRKKQPIQNDFSKNKTFKSNVNKEGNSNNWLKWLVLVILVGLILVTIRGVYQNEDASLNINYDNSEEVEDEVEVDE